MKVYIIRSVFLYCLIFPLLAIAVSCNNSVPEIRGTIKGIGNVTVYLHVFNGKDLKLVDSTQSKSDKFVFEMNQQKLHGMYHIRWGKGPADAIDIVYNHQNVIFYSVKDSLNLTTFENSPDNDLFFVFYPIRLTIAQLNNLGDEMYAADPAGNRERLIELSLYIDSLEYSANKMLQELDSESKNLFAFKVMRAAFTPNFNYENSKSDTKQTDEFSFFQKNYFKYIDFNEPGLTRTPFLYSQTEEYLNQYVYPKNSELYSRACDFIISKAAVNDEMYDYMLNLLIRTFETSDFWEVYLYLMETYQTEICEETEKPDDKNVIYELIKSSRPGNQIPDITGLTPEGKTVSLYKDVAGKAIVLLFWDPDCQHCKMIIDQLVTVWPYYHELGLNVATFALTRSREEWLTAISAQNMNYFLNMTDYKDTESLVFDKLHIRGTPEIYVLTADYKIFSRPINYMQIDSDIMKLLHN